MALAPNVTALVLAAGLSRRMGQFKLTLPWGGTTVIGRVIATLTESGLADVVVVTGHRAGEIEAALAGLPVRFALNQDFADGSMLTSIRAGLAEVGPGCDAALICLGDQPQMRVASVRAVLGAGAESEWKEVIIPSYRMRSGHPILLPSALWGPVRASHGTLRDILRDHRATVHYLVVDSPTVLADLDTPEDYDRAQRELTGGEPCE